MTNETTASQPKSIGDDAQFHQLLKAYADAPRDPAVQMDRDAGWAAFKELRNYIDSRAPAAQASATIQAAPDERERFEQFLRGEWKKNLIRGEDEIRPARFGFGGDGFPGATYWHRETERAWLAWQARAAIQEPVMVAEPVGQVQDSAAQIGWFNVKYETFFKLGELAHSDYNTELLNSGEIIPVYRTAQLVESTTPAAPMVADPAGVAKLEAEIERLKSAAVELEKWHHAKYKMSSDYIAGLEAKLAATVKAVPSEALELTELADAMQYWGGVFADGFAEAGDAVRSRGYSDERWVNARSALEWMRNRLYKHGKMGHPDAHAKYGSPFPGAVPLADKTGGGDHE